MSSAKLIFDNKFLLEYILEFDNTNQERFKKEIVFSKSILYASHMYWYKRYEIELFSQNSNTKKVLELQDAYFDTLYKIVPNILRSR